MRTTVVVLLVGLFVAYVLYMRTGGWPLVAAVLLILVVLVYFGITLRPWWAKTLCWLAFVGIIGFLGMFLWAFTHYRF
jgi:hypothetical protein